ncbi:hypothetical protein [Haloferula sp.]|uniref:hypothetical protein n=1 Tax=Haloferula sp. TaxID=2497595 RepID=UPI003C745ABA
MLSFTYQPSLRPELPQTFGPKEYREERALFIRIDEILTTSGLEGEFIKLAMEHHGLDPAKQSARRIAGFCRTSILALRSNIARHFKGMDHRDFCIRLADSPLLQWFLQIGRVDRVKAFAKSTSDRFARWIGEAGLRSINNRLIALLAGTDTVLIPFDLKTPVNFDDIYFDSTCLKAPIHFPIDWVLLRDATRTLMKATVLIRRVGLRHRMPQEPLEFLSDINTLCMKMTAKNRTKDGRKHRKAVLREMKALTKRIGRHARNHLDILTTRSHETDLTPGQIDQLGKRIESILIQLPAAIKQAHERIIGGRKLPNTKKILSFYDPDVQVIVRGKSNAEVEFGNNLWLGETREGFIADYLLEKEKTSDAKQIQPAIMRLVRDQCLPVGNVWGDRALHSAANDEFLKSQEIRSGLCPRNVVELADRLENEPGMREGLKRRAGTEARVSILIRDFMGKPARAKGFEHRELMVGWAVLSHNLWVLARLERENPAEEIERQVPEAA